MNPISQIVAQQAIDNRGIDTISTPTFLFAQNTTTSTAKTSISTTTLSVSSSKSSSALPYTANGTEHTPSTIIIIALVGFIAILTLMLFADKNQKQKFEKKLGSIYN